VAPRPAARALSVLLAVAVLTLFWPAVGNDFVNYDDDLYVTRNPRVQQGLTAAGVRGGGRRGGRRRLREKRGRRHER